MSEQSPSYDLLRKSEAENRYEAGMYKCLYELWEKRASEYQSIIIDQTEALCRIRDFPHDRNSSEQAMSQIARAALPPAKPCVTGER